MKWNGRFERLRLGECHRKVWAGQGWRGQQEQRQLLAGTWTGKKH